MQKYDFARETMDYRLFWIGFFKRIWVVIVAILLGTVLVGVPYYLFNVTFGAGPKYEISSEYYLDYAEDSSGALYEYFNYYTWSEIVDTDEFIMILQDKLPEGMFAADTSLKNYTDATVESDTRYLTTTVATEHPDKTVLIARALEEAIAVFADNQKELNSVRVLTAPVEASKVYPDVRPVRAFILGAVLGLFVGLLYLCICLICDSSILLPHTLEKRYGVKALGCKSFSESKNNICYFVKEAKGTMILVVGRTEGQSFLEAVEFIEDCVRDSGEVCVDKKDILAEDFDFDAVRKKDGLILLIEAGAKNGKKIERVIEQLKRQDIQISGAFLYNEDKKLIKQYYR